MTDIQFTIVLLFLASNKKFPFERYKTQYLPNRPCPYQSLCSRPQKHDGVVFVFVFTRTSSFSTNPPSPTPFNACWCPCSELAVFQGCPRLTRLSRSEVWYIFIGLSHPQASLKPDLPPVHLNTSNLPPTHRNDSIIREIWTIKHGR